MEALHCIWSKLRGGKNTVYSYPDTKMQVTVTNKSFKNLSSSSQNCS